jgi:hypothetical protein
MRSKRVQTCLNCLSFPMHRSMRLRFLYARTEREQGTQGGQKREHADDGMTAAPETLCFLSFSEF